MSKKETIKILTIKEVENFNKTKQNIGMKTLFRRKKIFQKDNYTCIECGTRGCFWALELRKNGIIEIQLYGINTNGEEVLMTIDHNIPLSGGGTDGLHNQQTMCAPCNNKKGNKYSEDNINSRYA